MVEMGARYLVLMLRSRIVNVKVKRGLVDDLEPRGCRVLTPKVDIADKDAFAALLQQCAVKLPPVARSIQATMVLRVRSHNPDPAPYTTNTSNRIPTSPPRPSPTGKPAPPPKVHGSWNLHILLPNPSTSSASSPPSLASSGPSPKPTTPPETPSKTRSPAIGSSSASTSPPSISA